MGHNIEIAGMYFMSTSAEFTSLNTQRISQNDTVIALAANPNAGMQIVLNALMGLDKSSKIVSNIENKVTYEDDNYIFVDLPGVDSLLTHSEKSVRVRNFLCFGGPDAVIVVCEAATLERSLNLVLQTIEITPNVVVCINSIVEARKKHLLIDCAHLAKCLGVPVVAVNARHSKGIHLLMEQTVAVKKKELQTHPPAIRYIRPIEKAISILQPAVKEKMGDKLSSRWAALRMMDYDAAFTEALNQYLNCDILSDAVISQKIAKAQTYLADCGIFGSTLHDNIASCVVLMAEGICNDCVFS